MRRQFAAQDFGESIVGIVARHRVFSAHAAILNHDPIALDRIMVHMFRWSMILSENRRPLFGIMLRSLLLKSEILAIGTGGGEFGAGRRDISAFALEIVVDRPAQCRVR